jgi:hypothetical protein
VVRFSLTQSQEVAPVLTLDPQTWLTQQDPLHVIPFRDPLVEHGGHDPRSQYVETFYLAILGPSALVAARRLAVWLDASPDGFTIPLAVLARQLGLGTGTARNAPLPKTLARLVGFGLAAVIDDAYALRRAFPPLTPRQVRRLPVHLATAHERYGQVPAAPATSRTPQPACR